MRNDFWIEILSGMIGLFSSLIVVWVVFRFETFRKRRVLRDSLILHLNENIIPHAIAIKNEIPKAKTIPRFFYDSKNIQNFGTYPTFNADYLRNIDFEIAQKVLGKELLLLIYVIGRLNRLEKSIPYILIEDFGQTVNQHIKEYSVE